MQKDRLPTALLFSVGTALGFSFGALLAGLWRDVAFPTLLIGLIGICLAQGVLCLLVALVRKELRQVEHERIVGRRILRLRSSGEEDL